MSPTAAAVLAVLAVTVAVILAALAASVAWYLARVDGATVATALTRAGITFGATLTLLALVATTLSDLIT
ncbi:hypothetical protein ACFY8N_39110 [Streptomyces collinus]|uniref:hypothetical protein n=1 Tax=Streptomyces collinus TaxID=42684 RepID=UPI003686CBC2